MCWIYNKDEVRKGCENKYKIKMWKGCEYVNWKIKMRKGWGYVIEK